MVSGTTGDKKGALSPNTESAFSEHSLRQEWCAPRAPCWRSLRKQSYTTGFDAVSRVAGRLRSGRRASGLREEEARLSLTSKSLRLKESTSAYGFTYSQTTAHSLSNPAALSYRHSAAAARRRARLRCRLRARRRCRLRARRRCRRQLAAGRALVLALGRAHGAEDALLPQRALEGVDVLRAWRVEELVLRGAGQAEAVLVVGDQVDEHLVRVRVRVRVRVGDLGSGLGI